MNGYHIAPAPADVAAHIKTQRQWLRVATDWRQQQALVARICRSVGFLALMREIEAAVGIDTTRRPV